MKNIVRHDWSSEEILKIYSQSFLDLIFHAQTIHRLNFKPGEVQKSTLLSIKTGGCPEDCSYCPQAARYQTDSPRHDLLSVEEVVKNAKQAKEDGSTRFCMGAAWREVKDGPEFDQVIEMVKEVKNLGLETCCTLGMLNENQAKRLKEAGLEYYNHNIDTSEEYYDDIISTRTYEDRLRTLENVRQTGIKVCCGGIVGLGETREDRVEFLKALVTQNPHPESVPINRLVKVEGTPLADQEDIPVLEFIRTIATARIIMPKSYVRLSAGRKELSVEAQALAFMAGANSVFSGEKLLTTPNPEVNLDAALFEQIGLNS